MWIFNWAILVFLVLIMPLSLGMLPVKYMNKARRTPAMLYACGWFVSFALFELVSIPFILLQRSFTELVIVYTVCMLIAFAISIWKGHSVLRDCISTANTFRALSPIAKIGWCVAVLSIIAQLLAAIFLEYWDGDDSYYMAQAMIADTYDVMYLRDAYTGYEFGFDIRHALSPVPIYLAWLSKLSGIHVLIVAHSVIAPIWMLLMYSVYGLIAEKLFEQNKGYVPLFMILISIWQCFGNVSIYTAETFSMTRMWQGKGLMAGVVMPVLWLCVLYFTEERVYRGVWMLFITSIMTACFATSTSIMLVPTVVGVTSIFISWKKRRIGWMLKMCLCCLPCVLVGACYVFLR